MRPNKPTKAIFAAAAPKSSDSFVRTNDGTVVVVVVVLVVVLVVVVVGVDVVVVAEVVVVDVRVGVVVVVVVVVASTSTLITSISIGTNTRFRLSRTCSPMVGKMSGGATAVTSYTTRTFPTACNALLCEMGGASRGASPTESRRRAR